MPDQTKEPPSREGGRPKWACGKSFLCSLLRSDVLVSCPADEADDSEAVLAAFFYHVAEPKGGENLGVMLVCASITLYAVLDGVPKAFSTLKQVCLPYGCGVDVSASGEGGSVLWSDMSLQRILRYDCMSPNGDERHMLRYARYVKFLSTPSFAELGSEGEVENEGADGESRTEDSGSRVAEKVKVIRDGAVLDYGGKTYAFVGNKRWQNVRLLIAAAGEYAECGKGLKAQFANHPQAKAFYEAAVEAEGLGRKGTGRYRLKV